MLLAADPAHEQAVDERQDEDERAEHDHAAQQLVEIEQAVAHEVLRQEVEVDDDEGAAEAGRARHDLEQDRRHRREAAHEQVQQAGLLDARGRRAVALVEIEDREVEAREHVGQERDGEPGRRVQRLDEPREEQHRVEHARAHDGRARQGRRARLVAEEGLEEALRRRGQRDGHDQREPREEGRVEALREERDEAEGRDVEGQRREQDVRAAPRVAQQHRPADREAHDGGDER